MGRNKLNRVVFYSKHDGASTHELQKTEELLLEINLDENKDLNDLLELYHVKLYFDNNMFLSTWDDSTIEIFKTIIEKATKVTTSKILCIDDDTVINTIETLEFDYREAFWELFNNLHVYKKIQLKTFGQILQKFPSHINDIISQKSIAKHFEKEIKVYLINFEKAAELLLSSFEEKHTDNSPTYYFPTSLSQSEKENIIHRYIDSNDPNLNYLKLIENSNSNELRLSTKIKLKARKKAIELSERMLNEGTSWKTGVEVGINNEQIEAVKYSTDNGIAKVYYSLKYLEEQDTNLKLFKLFKSLFFYIDEEGLITLYSKDSELNVLEKIFMKSKNEYLIGETFHKKRYLSISQIIIFKRYLSLKGNSIEKLIESYIENYLKNYIENLQFKFPNENSTYTEKIRSLAPEFEFLLKQFKTFVDDGQIDFELIEFSSFPLRLIDIKSLVEKKYIYSNSETINILIRNFFSDQSLLHYVEPFKNKYKNFYTLLMNEDVNYKNFKNYQQRIIDYLVAQNHLLIDDNNIVRIKNIAQIFVVGQIYSNEVLNYWHYTIEIRHAIDDMISEGLLSFENTLFSKTEINYLNFYLNKKDFTNGYDIRNKYLHGTNTTFEEQQEIDYYSLLKLIILTLLKIEDDLIVHNKHTAQK